MCYSEKARNRIKKIIVSIISIGLISFFGCASVSYDAPNGEHFSYNRLGTQQIQGFKTTKNKDGSISVEFNNQVGGENIANFFELTITTIMKNLLPISSTNSIVPK